MRAWGDAECVSTARRCLHCSDPYADEATETRYASLCPSCADWARDCDDRDERERIDQDERARRRFYDCD